ncbi:SNF2 family N-terminal domain-containing protein [Lophiotrema nucula]|uniref:SNF2 family N-terminal domain-containing protein n=1 Tax=Lophiotrema nucula TaxID=690887 RepID=A0A6A5YZW2_9PLEO|nr:SNF2 family N-terminal domain-containing protein [Lophiotrema nucula]
MAAISVVADITETHIHGRPASEPSINSLEAVQQFLTPYPSTTIKGEGNASKKRKLDNGEAQRVQRVDEFDGNKSVVLVKVSVELCFPTSDGEPQMQVDGSDDELARPAVVSLESFNRTSPDTFALSLWSRSNPTNGIDFVATAPSAVVDSIALHLETAASLRTTQNGRKRTTKAGVSFCRAVLGPLSRGPLRVALETEIRFPIGVAVAETLGPRNRIGQQDVNLLATYMPDDDRLAQTPWALSDFYDAVHVPATDLKVSPRIQKSSLETQLYPFQQRAVDWLLQREGVSFSEAGELQNIDQSGCAPVSFSPVRDALGRNFFISHLRGMVVSDLSAIHDSSRTLRGGILAEEMGLGKTVELIALLSHHQRDIPQGDVFDAYTGAFVKPSGSTLIITPPSILDQWINEVKIHAPQLKVFHYTGIPAASAPRRDHEAATVENLLRYDIVVTTYQVLSREVHFAKPPPDRSFRHAKKHEPRRSPLVSISWWRVCLDEAQMVESGVSQAAVVARIIPRCNAWAVSGTPLRKDIQDLRGLLTFLRYEPFASSKAVWERLDKPTFQAIFSQIAMRHTKDKIREELRLPPQKRVVITVPFTAIEEQNYSEMIRQMCDACGLSPEGIPIDEDQSVDSVEVQERMREWLVRLRQTCLHAHVGRRNRRALGAKNGPLRTVHEVLEVMIEQNDTSLKAEAREHILARMRSGHVSGNARDNPKRSVASLPVYQTALAEAQGYVKTCRDELVAEKEKVGLALIETKDEDDSDDEDGTGEKHGRVAAVRKTIRSFLELEHACQFFIGTAYFQIKSNEELTKPESEEFHNLEKLEVQWYDSAKAIRKELLQDSQNRAQRQMKKIQSRQAFTTIPEIADIDDLGGIENVNVLRMMDDVTEVLNAQAEQLAKWRQKVVDILLLPLVDEDEGKETTGDEYEDSTKVQDELYVYIMALRVLVADRNAAVNGLQDILLDHEMKEAVRHAKDTEGHAPELVLEVAKIRSKLKPGPETGSLKGVVTGLRALITGLQWRADAGDNRAAVELAVTQKHLTKIQRIASEQAKAVTELEKEQEVFRAAMNQRLEFYRQLQHISDTVAPWKEELDPVFDRREYDRQMKKIYDSEKKLGGLKTKHAYLTNLRRENQQEDLEHDCIICQETFEIGVLTTCGHKYCKECINQWWYEHRTCPLCKMRLHTSDFKDINFKPGSMKAQEETHDLSGSPSQASTPSSAGTSIYSDINETTMKEIKTIDLEGSYGTKVDMIARHLLWIRNNDPGAKSIIFSQFGDFLEVLREALKRWKIGASSIGDKHGISKFKADPAVECFLLDAKSDSSGLNLVNATYVFLCEPLINPAIELQAIARVHRIGQQRATTVYMYLVNDTVEEAIYDISVARRLEHIGKSNASSRSGTATPALQEKTLDNANSKEMEAAPLKQLLRKKGDGEVVQVDDLWKCLFGKPRKVQRPVLDKEVGRHLRAEAAERRIAEESVEAEGSAS